MKAALSRVFASSYFRTALGLLVSGISLYLVLRKVTFQQVWSALAQADMRFVGLALLSVAVNVMAKVVRWQVLLSPAGKKISLSPLSKSILAGQLLNTLYPARIGDLSRAYVIGGLGPGRVYTLGTIVVEKLLDTLAYALLFFLLVLLMPLPNWVNDSAYTVTLAVLLVSALAIFLARRPQRLLQFLEIMVVHLPERFRSSAGRWLHSAVSSLAALQGRSELLGLAFWTSVVWATAILNNYFALLAMQLYLPFTASLLVLIVLQVSITLPSVPGNIGLFEALCVLALGVYGVSQTSGLAYGIVLHSIIMVPTTLLGVLFLWMLGFGKRPLKVEEGSGIGTNR
jgi:uncharacterized protein (TIRG00374 family)